MTTAAERLAGSLGDRYRIDRELGRGGMATVYLAEDTRHHRRVAIKVLHPELSAVLGPDRFLKEIELTANLQHPHILPLFDSGSAEGLLYYVMPFVEGETLRARMDRERQLPVPDVVRIGIDIAAALDYAHKRHVVHRDIKPENILLLDGRPLVADFGIALAVEQAGGMRMTQTGISLGTPQYMSPEQAMGDKGVDHRADIYSLGAVMYEMLAGHPPFVGPNAQAIVARVITEKPRSLSAMRDSVPAYLDEAIYAALQKLPADRPGTAQQFGRLLAEPQRASPFEFVPAERMSTTSLVAGIVLTASLFGIAGYALGYRSNSLIGAAEPSRLSMLAPELGGAAASSLRRQIAITPDGKAVVYVASEDGKPALYYHRLDAERPVMIPGSAGITDPVIAPDGKLILGASGLNPRGPYNVTIPITGGDVTQVSSDVNTSRAIVDEDRSIWYTTQTGGEIRKLTADGKSARVKVPRGMRLHQMLDKQRAIMVRSPLGTVVGPASIVNLATGEATTFTTDAVGEIRYAKGYVVFSKGDQTLWAARFDRKRGVLTSKPVQIGANVAQTGTGISQFAMSENGNLAYIPEEPRSLVLVDRDGKLRPATSERRNFHSPRFSPDGSRISVDFTTVTGRDVWVLSLSQGTLSRATFDRDGHDATWARDGAYLTYTSLKRSVLTVYSTRPGGGAQPDSLIGLAALAYTGEWLSDGRRLATTLTDLRPESGSDIGLIENGGKGPVTPVIANQFQTLSPVVSPSMKWIAFVSDQSGSQEVYVRALDDSSEAVQVSLDGGTEPVWSRDGRELFYRGTTARGQELIAASVRTDAGFDVTSRRALFPVDDMIQAFPHANYDVSPDGKTFVLTRRSPTARVIMIQNLPELVKRMQESAGKNN